MNRRIQNVLATLGVTIGLIATTAQPAMAGFLLSNHTEPTNRR